MNTTLAPAANHNFFVTCPLGVEPLLSRELTGLGADAPHEQRAGVTFAGTLETAYRACLWSRLANRVLLRLGEFPAGDFDALYVGARGIDWPTVLDARGTFAVGFTESRSTLGHSHYAALKVKDAIVDACREITGQRPDVDTARPDVRVHVHVEQERGEIYLDLSGESLHRRGYRDEGGAAPLKENLAAAILLRAGWPEAAAEGCAFLDPMCGSGTLCIEAALIAADSAPGLLRDYFGFFGWRGHDGLLWARLREEAQARRAAGFKSVPKIVGYDEDRRAVRAALENVARAGLTGLVHIEKRELADAAPVAPTGLLVVNPPYGERLGDEKTVPALYERLGEVLKSRFTGWRAAVFTGNPELGFRLGIRSEKPLHLRNGALECVLLRLTVEESRFFTPRDAGQDSPARQAVRDALRLARQRKSAGHGGAEDFANRLRKNLKHLSRWAKREGVDCYRVYDADLPEYALAVDLYQGEERWVLAQEYAAPRSIDPALAEARLADALAEIPALLDIRPDHLFLKVRQRQKGAAQYERESEAGRFHTVFEHGGRFWVNFEDYLDTGLFLDHRVTRQKLGAWAKGQRFLNLFCYTATATVHAALGGARASTSVDMSATYLDWAGRNFELNGLDRTKHERIQADCLAWLEEARRDKRRYDLIFLDPPSFSNSKRMADVLDVQRDHPHLIRACLDLLAPGGTLVFSTNLRTFRLEAESLGDCRIEDISRATLPPDFARNPRIHQCWTIRPEE